MLIFILLQTIESIEHTTPLQIYFYLATALPVAALGQQSPTPLLEPAFRRPLPLGLAPLGRTKHASSHHGAHSLEEFHAALLACLLPEHHRQHDIAEDYLGERLPGGRVTVAASASRRRGALLARRPIADRLLA
jgi:hypothetical protein